MGVVGSEGWLNEAEFAAVVSLTSIVSVDLLVFDGEGRILLGRRTNEPARGTWFTPGGKVRKFEPLDAALRRVSATELGAAPCGRAPPLHGVYRHMYETSRFPDEGNGEKGEKGERGERKEEDEAPWSGRGGTDYVNFAYRLTLAEDYGGAQMVGDAHCAQHEAMRWFTVEEAMHDPDVHPYVKCYFHPHAWNRLV